MELREILSCYNSNEDRWKELKKRYERSKIVPFVGAGMSVPIYPQWAEAINNILNGDKEEVEELNKLFDENNYEEACEYVKGKISDNVFIDRVKTEFSAEKITKSNDQIMKKVNSIYLYEIFSGSVFTTNFDKMVEHCYKHDFRNTYSLSNMGHSWSVIYDAIRNNNHNLYKIHGDIDDSNSWVFSKQQYDDVYGREEFINVIKTVCENMNFLFLGCSLTESDRYINVLASVTKDFMARGIEIKNFAFISLPNGENKTNEEVRRKIEIKERHLGSIGIFPIWYPFGRHEAIPVLLRELKREGIVERKFNEDKTQKKKHFNLFSSNICVYDAFVDNCFEFYCYDSGLNSTKPCSINLNNIVELSERNRLIFIEGKYGSGKTVLSTRIQWELQKKYKTLFFNAEDYYNNEEISKLLNNIDSKCFVIIDGIDKLVDNSMDLKALEILCKRIDGNLKANNNISFIANSRIYCRINSNKNGNNELVSMYVALEMQRDNLIVIKTNGFLTKENYERFFANINPDFTNTSSLTGKIVKQWHKKSPLSCQVPLFAYAIGTYYYDMQKKNGLCKGTALLPDNKMIVYEEFVKKTIKGRFQEESLEGTINERLYDKYESLLRKIAIRMIHEMRDNIDYQEDVSKSREFSDKEVYAIDVRDFSEEIQEQLSEIVNESRKKEVILSDAINNYFFNIFKSSTNTNTKVRFSDINVMCCFAAAYIYDIIIGIAEYKDSADVKNNFEKLMRDLGMVELQPQVMDFLMCKIHTLDNAVIDVLLTNILLCINIYNQTQAVSKENVRAMLVIYIVYIKFCRRSYKETGALNLFKTFYRLCMTAKALNINGIHRDGGHRYLAERYFMECTFIACQFKRLNYKYYNFSKVQIKSSSFDQCNFLDNEFVGAKLRNSTFKLCTLKTKLEKITIDGKIVIENSILDSVSIEELSVLKNSGIVHFRGCTVLKLLICDTDNKKLRILFENCILSELKIKKCKGIVIEIKECVIKNKVSLDSNSVIYSDNGEYFDGRIKSLDNLEDDFRKDN